MTKYNIEKEILEKANKWLSPEIDDATRNEVQRLINEAPEELTECFYRDLEFGTGGLRGIMGVGTNRMNRYTVGMSTQGLANYLKNVYGDSVQIKAAIAYDCRNNNTVFADTSADVLSANGIKVYLFDALRPTPELSYAVRHFGCHTGIVVTASHNPKEYNGYKVYWKDGGQLISPHDVNVINEVQKIGSIADVKFNRNNDLVEIIGDEIDDLYLKKMASYSLSPEIISRQSDMKIVYTPIHGTGVKLVPLALEKFGFKNIINVPEQDVVDGNFPTVHSPNPEEPPALEMAIAKAEECGADLVMATDPDADRVGIAVRDNEGKMILLNGNQTASLLIYYLLSGWNESGKLTGNEFICKTIVTTGLLKDIADKYSVPTYDVLTGFKYIADLILRLEGKKTFIGGGEESYGYMIGDYVRDKDAVISCCMIAETAAWAKENGKTLYELLTGIYLEFGFYKEHLISVVRKGKAGSEEIADIMSGYRKNPPSIINNADVIRIIDYKSSKDIDLVTGNITDVDLPSSNVLQFFTADGSKITVRPSGTEPKIKFYFGVKENLQNIEEFENVKSGLKAKIDGIIASMNLA